MSFANIKKDLQPLFEQTISPKGLAEPVIVRGATINQQIGVAQDKLSVTDLFAECVRDLDGGQMSSEEWELFLQGKQELASELLVAITDGGTDEEIKK